MKSRKEIEDMSDEERRIKTAELCGLERLYGTPYDSFKAWKPRSQSIQDFIANGEIYVIENELPDYLNSLDAMHEAERVRIYPVFRIEYSGALKTVVEEGLWKAVHATARQRNTAFLMVLL